MGVTMVCVPLPFGTGHENNIQTQIVQKFTLLFIWYNDSNVNEESLEKKKHNNIAKGLRRICSPSTVCTRVLDNVRVRDEPRSSSPWR